MTQRDPTPIDVNRMHRFLKCNYETGEIFWKVYRNRDARAGDRAGSPHSEGYRHLQFDGKHYREHRIIASMYLGYDIGELEVNHLNHIRDDNRVVNLSLVDDYGQARDTKLHSNNTSGVCGVQILKKGTNRFKVWISCKPWGHYATMEEATLCAQYVYKSLGYSENHGKPLVEIISARKKAELNNK